MEGWSAVGKVTIVSAFFRASFCATTNYNSADRRVMKELRKSPSFTTKSLHIYDSRLMTDGAIYCNRCGAQNSAMAKFCANCGTPFSSEVQPPAPQPTPPEISPRPQTPAWHVPPA